MDINITSAGGACPYQAYGTIDGEQFYFRFRHDSAQLEVGPDVPDRDGLMYAERHDVTGDEWNGSLSDEEALALIIELAEKLAPVSEDNPTYGQRLAAAVEEMVKQLREEREAAATEGS